jgi:exosortase
MSPVENQLPVLAQREIETLRPLRAWGFAVVLLTFLTWAWWPFVRQTTATWFTAPEYGVGLTLLLLGVGVAIFRRKHVPRSPLQLDRLGLVILVCAIVLRFSGTAVGSEFAEGVSWIAAVAGIAVVCAGRDNVHWLLPPILFLGFLIPLPYRISHAVAEPLQQLVTDAATYFAQLCGYPAVNSGKLLLVNDATVDVARTCVGLKSLVPFIALATGIGLLAIRPWWQRLFLTASAVPVGIFLLAVRVTAFSVFDANGSPLQETVAKYGVWISLAIAVPLFLFELWLLANLFLDQDVVPVSRGSGLKNAMPIVVSPNAPTSSENNS